MVKMKQTISIISLCILLASIAFAIDDPGRPDTLSLESIEIAPGQSGVIALRAIADDSTAFNDKVWRGVGSFCIPMKYYKNIMKVDSIKFAGSVANWDEKFANPRIDTGFVSLAGIYNISGKEKPALFSPEKGEVIARFYFTVDKKASKGSYGFALTSDPIQKELYFGSIDGFHSWKPVFIPGIIKVK
jgi:hypothetical protein